MLNREPDAPAFLALWNSVLEPGARREYEQWHSLEHVPERVALPGFVAAERYRSVDEVEDYFTLYQLESLAALETGAYRDVFTHPTPWSARMRPLLGDFYRLPCVRSGSLGPSRSPCLMTLRWRSSEPCLTDRLNEWLARQSLHGDLVHAEWGYAPATAPYWKANTASDTQGTGLEHVALLQHYALDDLRESQQALARFLRPHVASMGHARCYQLQSSVTHADAATSTGSRRAPHPVLFNHYTQG